MESKCRILILLWKYPGKILIWQFFFGLRDFVLKKKIWKRRAFSLNGRYFSKTKEKEKLRFLPHSKLILCISIHKVLFASLFKRSVPPFICFTGVRPKCYISVNHRKWLWKYVTSECLRNAFGQIRQSGACNVRISDPLRWLAIS